MPMKKNNNRLSFQAYSNAPFNNITIHNSKYVRVNSIKVTITLHYSDEICTLFTKNPQLIHMMIDRCEIERNLPFMEWEHTVRSILFKEKGIKDSDLDQFVDWNLGNLSFSLARYRRCTKKRSAHLDFVVLTKK